MIWFWAAVALAALIACDLCNPKGKVFLLGEDPEETGYPGRIDSLRRWPVLAQIPERATGSVLTTARIDRE